jgi:uncharacterized tellurite resistance protein B-like protein
MNLTDLNPDERVALVALVVQMVGADGQSTDAEMDEYRAIADEMGKKEFDEAMRRATAEAGTREAAIAFAKRALTRADAAEMVHTILADLAGADDVVEAEKALLREVAQALKVYSRF